MARLADLRGRLHSPHRKLKGNTMTDVNEFIRRLILSMKANGWNKSYASVSFTTRGEEPEFNYVYVYPVLEEENGETFEAGALYCCYLGDEASQAAFRDRVLSVAKKVEEFKIGKLLDLVAQAQRLGEAMSLPADFLNPLTLMADKLRTNILTKQEESL